MDRDISLDAIKLVACIFVCTHTIGMFMSESSDFHLSYLLFYMSGIAVPLFFMVNGFLLAPKDGGMKYYYRKIFNIVKIVCVFTFIFDIPKLVRGDISILMPFKQACSSLFFQGGVFPVFWFLGSLIFIYALMPFLKKYIKKPATMFIINFIVYTVLDYLIQLFLDLGFGIELPKYHSYLAFMNGEAYLGDGAVFALLGCAFFYYFAPRWNSLFLKLKKWMRISICILLTAIFVFDLLSGIIQY